MKPPLLSLLAVALGFGFSRVVPGNSGSWNTAATLIPDSARPDDSAGKAAGEGAVRPQKKAEEEQADWQSAAKAWMKGDPAGFYQWLIQRGIPPDDEMLMDLFSEWVKKDVDAAFTAALSLPPDFQNRHEVPGLMDSMLREALDQPGGLRACWKWIPQAIDGRDGFIYPSSAWLKSAPPEEWAAFLKSNTRNSIYESSLSSLLGAYWAGTDREAAMVWMRSLPPMLRQGAFSGIMEIWSKQDPAAALSYLATNATADERESAHVALATMAQKDPAAALEWWEKNLGVSLNGSLDEIYAVWCDGKSAQALEYSRGINDPGLRHQCLTVWGQVASAREVLAALEELPRGPDRLVLLDAFSSNGDNWEKNSTADIRRLLSLEPPETISYELTKNISIAYTRQDPAAAFRWAGTLPENRQTESLSWILRGWTDEVAAAQAVDQLRESAFKTAAQKALQEKLGESGRYR